MPMIHTASRKTAMMANTVTAVSDLPAPAAGLVIASDRQLLVRMRCRFTCNRVQALSAFWIFSSAKGLYP